MELDDAYNEMNQDNPGDLVQDVIKLFAGSSLYLFPAQSIEPGTTVTKKSLETMRFIEQLEDVDFKGNKN